MFDDKRINCPNPHPNPVQLMPAGISKRKFQLYICPVDGEIVEVGYGVVTRVGGKGFGFIKAGTAEEIFFHLSDCLNNAPLREGSMVSFRLAFNHKGLVAKQVKVHRP